YQKKTNGSGHFVLGAATKRPGIAQPGLHQRSSIRIFLWRGANLGSVSRTKKSKLTHAGAHRSRKAARVPAHSLPALSRNFAIFLRRGALPVRTRLLVCDGTRNVSKRFQDPCPEPPFGAAG